MKIFTFLFLFLLSPTVSAQTINSNWIKIDSNLTYYTTHATNFEDFTIPETGENVIWDFSNLEGSGNITTFNIKIDGSSTEHDLFPNADIVIENWWHHFRGFRFYKQKENCLLLIGSYSDYVNLSDYEHYWRKVNYLDPLVEFETPFQYNNSFSDSYFTYIENSHQIPNNENGEVQNEFIGYGDLIMPYETLEDCALIRKIYSSESVLNDTIYNIYHKSFLVPYITYYESSILFLTEPIDIFVGTDDINQEIIVPYARFINTNTIQLTSNLPLNALLEVYNLKGELIYKNTTSLNIGSNKISLSQNLSKQQFLLLIKDLNTGKFQSIKLSSL